MAAAEAVVAELIHEPRHHAAHTTTVNDATIVVNAATFHQIAPANAEIVASMQFTWFKLKAYDSF